MFLKSDFFLINIFFVYIIIFCLHLTGENAVVQLLLDAVARHKAPDPVTLRAEVCLGML